MPETPPDHAVPNLNEWLQFFSADGGEDRFTPRSALVVADHGNGRYDVLVVGERDAKDLWTRENDVSFFAPATVRGNLRGDTDAWDWNQTGQKFICRQKPTIIPYVRPAKAIVQPKAPDGAPAPKPAQAPAPSGDRPRVPQPGAPNPTRRMTLKAGASAD